MTRWMYLEISLDPRSGRVTHIDGKEVTNPQAAPLARQVRHQLGSEGWELVSALETVWTFKRPMDEVPEKQDTQEIPAPQRGQGTQQPTVQQWEYCCLAEDHAGGIRRGEWILVYYHADGNHVEHEHRRLGNTLAQLGMNGWQMTSIASPGGDETYDNTIFIFARPVFPRHDNGNAS